MSDHPGWLRMLATRSVSPSQIGPLALNFRASAQSSISASRIASIPPICRKVSARASIHPPAAAAVARSARLTQENGYSIWKKKKNAGRRTGSDLLSHRNLTIRDEITARLDDGCATNP